MEFPVFALGKHDLRETSHKFLLFNRKMFLDSVSAKTRTSLFLRKFNSKIEDTKWHYLCITWDNTDGSYQLYFGGQLTDHAQGLRTGHVIKSGGTVVLGHYQDNMGGGFDMNAAFGPGFRGKHVEQGSIGKLDCGPV